jgi:hypothetical protein
VSYSRPTFPDDHFTRVPNAWIRDGNLRPNAKAILFAIMSHDAGYKLTTAQLMRETGLGRDAVNAARDHMLDRGYLIEVRQTTGERGRFAENHYVVTDCLGVPPPRRVSADPQISPPNVRIRPQRSNTATVPTDDGQPAPIEEQGEKNTPAPTEQAGDGRGRHLTPIDGRTVAERAKVLATEHWEGVGKVPRYMGIQMIVRQALDAGHTDEQVRAALAALRRQGRNLSAQTLGLLIADPRRTAVGASGNGYRNASGRPRWEMPDRDSYDAGDGTF